MTKGRTAENVEVAAAGQTRSLLPRDKTDASPAPCHASHLISSVLHGEALIAAPTGLDLAPLKAAAAAERTFLFLPPFHTVVGAEASRLGANARAYQPVSEVERAEERLLWSDSER